MIEHLKAAFTAALILVFVLSGWSWWINPYLIETRFSQSPYGQATGITLVRIGGIIEGSFSLTKTRHCDFSESPPAYIRWRDENNVIATGRALVKTGDGQWRELAPRTVIPVGEKRTLGPVRMEIPPKFMNRSVLWAQLAVVCDRGDGIQRTFFITPVIRVTEQSAVPEIGA